jgi:hypothetical protein
VSFTRQEVCNHCRGKGAAHKRDILACPFCHGTGMRCSIAHQQGEPLGRFWQQLNTTCTKCDGTGHHINSTCPVCGGHKVLLKSVTKSVHVPPGAPDSYRITLANEGDQVPDLLPVRRPLHRRPTRHTGAERACRRRAAARGAAPCRRLPPLPPPASSPATACLLSCRCLPPHLSALRPAGRRAHWPPRRRSPCLHTVSGRWCGACLRWCGRSKRARQGLANAGVRGTAQWPRHTRPCLNPKP